MAFSDQERFVLRNAYLYKKALRCGKKKKNEKEATLLTKNAAMRELTRDGNNSVLIDRNVWKSARAIIKNFCTRVFVPSPIDPIIYQDVIPLQLWSNLKDFDRRTVSDRLRPGAENDNLEDIITSSEDPKGAVLMKNLSSSNSHSLSQLKFCLPLARELLAYKVNEQEEDMDWVLKEFDRNR